MTKLGQGPARSRSLIRPDGGWIVHATDGIDGNADIFVVGADGNGNQTITRSKLRDSAPDWGPAGS